MKRILVALMLSSFLLLLMAADKDRYNDLGDRIMCSCGCNQPLLQCNHVGCQSSDGMIRQLKAAVTEYPKDDDVLNWFRQNYGTTIVIAPSTHGFEGTIWWVPPVLSFMVLVLVIMLIRKWRMRAALAPVKISSDPRLEVLRSRAREETDL